MLDILLAVFRYRLMTTAQIHKAVFSQREHPGTENSVSNTMRKLHAAGFVSRDWVPVTPAKRARMARPSAIWFLQKANLTHIEADLAETGRADLFETLAPSAKAFKEGSVFADNTVRHELAITDFYVALDLCAASARRSIPLWLRTSPRHPDISRAVSATKTDKKTGREAKLTLPLNPDGFHVIQHPEKGCAFFLLEMDMNTETNAEKITKKFLAYYAYYEQGTFGADIAAPFARQYRLPVTRPEAAPFRVLFVAPNAKRRNDLLLKSRVLPTSNLFQFAILDEMLADPFGPVWLSKESFKGHLDEYNARTHTDNPGLLRTWAHSVLDTLPKHAL